MNKQETVSKTMKYYDLKKHWTKKIVPHLDDEKLNELLVTDFNKYTKGLWKRPFVKGQFPEDIESCDWRWDRKPPFPRYWKYVKHAACHWIVNFSLRLATLAEPDREWRIVSSQEHSTVWDGDKTLFDFNFQAMGISAAECWKAAIKENIILKPGKYRKTYLAIRD